MKEKIHKILPEEFPLEINLQYPQGAVSLHGHDFDELVIIQRGKGIHFTEREFSEIVAGDVFIIRKGRSHGYRDTENLHLVNILFHLDAMNMPKEELKKLPGYHALFMIQPEIRGQARFEHRLQLTPEQLAYASGIIEDITDETRKRTPGYEFMATANFMRLSGFLSRCYSKMYRKNESPMIRFANVISHIEQHFRDPVNIPILLKMSAMSRSAFFRAFRKSTGFSPIDYQLRLRISHASKLLKTGNFSVKEIAFMSGFHDSNYFSRQYKKITGHPPQKNLAR
jgi:AraC-like DNA-binding protein